MTDAAAPFRFVLVRTSHPGNIGAAARAIRTMGFDRLALVAPAQFPSREADALAANAVAVLAAATVHGDLPAALAPATLALGLSARRREVELEELSPREAAARAVAEAARGGTVALVFGNERTGLENAELACCHATVRIPSAEDYASLNLAQAVQVMAYELRLAMLERATPAAVVTTPAPAPAPAPVEQLERFFAHLADTLEAIDFHKGRDPTQIMLRLRRLVMRARPDERELRILHGILADAERMAALALGRDGR
ncbi:MAG: TrmJ/YjtD family RNA methyltransferase [Fulvimonas sp.]|nr:TrmJ/YjtD family RNA methyltransferase [Fulvimonas sp.]